MLVFEERGKTEYPEKNVSEQSREATNSVHIWRQHSIYCKTQWKEQRMFQSLHETNFKFKTLEFLSLIFTCWHITKPVLKSYYYYYDEYGGDDDDDEMMKNIYNSFRCCKITNSGTFVLQIVWISSLDWKVTIFGGDLFLLNAIVRVKRYESSDSRCDPRTPLIKRHNSSWEVCISLQWLQFNW